MYNAQTTNQNRGPNGGRGDEGYQRRGGQGGCSGGQGGYYKRWNIFIICYKEDHN